ncbi:hypothetical protein ACFY1V_31810 [Streptomyces sp. NPDC001255]|uniref:hypothetical protein n=1 Tax=Streptomyces sp. NPDC001255 TaxID=3364550 RepID=UPI0036977974
MTGIPVKKATLTGVHEPLVAGAAPCGKGNAQLHAVLLLGADIAHVRWLEEHGYTHPELQRCSLLGVSGVPAVRQMRHVGLVVDRDRALADAHHLLGLRRVSAAVDSVTAGLLHEGELTGEEVRARCGQPFPVPVWTPRRVLPMAPPHPRPGTPCRESGPQDGPRP